MSMIHQLTVRLVDSGEYSPKDYDRARSAVALQLATSAVRSSTPPPSRDGDYKDAAAGRSGSIWDSVVQYDVATRKAVARVLDSYGLLNGYSCPRSFESGLEKFLRDTA